MARHPACLKDDAPRATPGARKTAQIYWHFIIRRGCGLHQ
jgi:hypothetical protein